MNAYELKQRIDRKEDELQDMREELRRICTHPKECRKISHEWNHPDPLEVEVWWEEHRCQLCGESWRENERRR